jgi:predicted acetyltransferase
MAEADIEAAASMQVEAFGGNLPDVIQRYHTGPRSTWRDAWVVEHDGEVRAAALAIPARWWFGGCVYDASAIGGVAVRPTDRRRGFASELMRGLLRAEREAGHPYSVLYPFQHGFYRRLGYASAGLMHFWRLPTAQLPDHPRLRARVRLLRESDRSAIAELYARWLPAHSGFERKSRQWERRWATSDEKWVVFEDASNGIAAYLAYRANGSTLDIRELTSAHAEAERGLWAFVAAQVEQRTAVTYHSPLQQPLWATLREPHMFEPTNRGFIVTDMAALTISFMARVVDISAALTQRQYPPGLTGRLRLIVTDSVLAPDGESLALEFDGGSVGVSTSADKAEASCDIVTLSQLMCGALTASQARWYGLLEASEDAEALLDQAFPPGPPFIHPADWF